MTRRDTAIMWLLGSAISVAVVQLSYRLAEITAGIPA